MVKTINLRIEPEGLSANQRAALDQVAGEAELAERQAGRRRNRHRLAIRAPSMPAAASAPT
ncbi:MAG: hypothetical protein WDN06_06690 [Asticcacaulis sp.]